MTAPAARAAHVGAPSRAARARDVLAAEWIKLRSVRSNSWTLLFAAVATLGSTAVVAHAFASSPPLPPGSPVTPLDESFLGFAEYAVLPVTILGVLAFTAEYSTGLIRVTLTAVPRRRAVLAAKAAVTGWAALIAGELLAFASFFLTQAILSGPRGGEPLARPGAAGAVLAAGFVLTACGLIGLGFGAIVRHTAGAIAAALAVILGVAALCLMLPSPWQDRIGRLTLPFAAYQVTAAHPRPGLFAPAVSMLIVAAWPAAILLVAALLISRRDT